MAQLSKAQKRDLELIKKAFTAIDQYKTKFLTYELFFNSEHEESFLTMAKKYERSSLFIPLTYTTINIATAIFASAFFSKSPISIEKVSSDEDEKKKLALSRVVSSYYKSTKPFLPLELAFKSAAVFGLGQVKVYWDGDKPKTKFLKVLNVAYDIDADEYQDNQYVAEKFMQTLQKIKELQESGFYKIDPLDQQTLFSAYAQNPYKRMEVKELYSTVKGGFQVRTFINSMCVREKTFKRCPIKYGHMIQKLPAIEDSIAKEELAVIGDSLVRVMMNINKEVNIKRNQKTDLIEKILDPDVYVPEGVGLDPDDEMKVGGKKRCDTTQGLMITTPPSSVEFSNDMAMLKEELKDVSAIDGIMRGETSPSDRRAMSSIAAIAGNSSSRLENMIRVLNMTLFEPWAEDFVRECYINVHDAVVEDLMEGENPLGRKGTREELDFDIEVNFGESINKDRIIQNITAVLQILNARPDAEILPLLKELLTHMLGEKFDVEGIFANAGVAASEDVPGGDRGGDGQEASATFESTGQGRDSQRGASPAGDEASSRIAQILSQQM